MHKNKVLDRIVKDIVLFNNKREEPRTKRVRLSKKRRQKNKNNKKKRSNTNKRSHNKIVQVKPTIVFIGDPGKELRTSWYQRKGGHSFQVPVNELIRRLSFRAIVVFVDEAFTTQFNLYGSTPTVHVRNTNAPVTSHRRGRAQFVHPTNPKKHFYLRRDYVSAKTIGAIGISLMTAKRPEVDRKPQAALQDAILRTFPFNPPRAHKQLLKSLKPRDKALVDDEKQQQQTGVDAFIREQQQLYKPQRREQAKHKNKNKKQKVLQQAANQTSAQQGVVERSKRRSSERAKRPNNLPHHQQRTKQHKPVSDRSSSNLSSLLSSATREPTVATVVSSDNSNISNKKRNTACKSESSATKSFEQFCTTLPDTFSDSCKLVLFLQSSICNNNFYLGSKKANHITIKHCYADLLQAVTSYQDETR